MFADELSEKTLNAVKTCQEDLGNDLEWADSCEHRWGKWGDQMVMNVFLHGKDPVIKDMKGL